MSIKEIVLVNREADGLIAHEIKKINQYEELSGERALSHSFVMNSYRKIMGRTLTIIDASIIDKSQNKAIKDLIRNIFSDEMEYTSTWGYDEKIFNELTKDVDGKIESVDIEEALGVN